MCGPLGWEILCSLTPSEMLQAVRVLDAEVEGDALLQNICNKLPIDMTKLLRKLQGQLRCDSLTSSVA